MQMTKKTFLKENELINDSFRLGVDIFQSGFSPTFIVGLWRGGSSVGIYVQECLQYLGIETNHIAVRTSYSGLTEYDAMVDDPTSKIRVHGMQYLLESLSSDDRLLLVDDVCGSGWTLKIVQDRLRERLRRNMPTDVRTAVVWYKPRLNQTGEPPDYFVHETDRWLVLPYELSGLTLDEIRAHKPVVADLLSIGTNPN